MAFAMAVSEAQKNAERGMGYAICDEQGRFFCGFEQANGALAHGDFIQNGKYWREVRHNHFKHDKPVFLSLEDMRQNNIAAAVFGMSYQANWEHGLDPESAERCKRYIVNKDLTWKPQSIDHKPVDPLYPPASRSGLASAESCGRGRDDGYIGLFYGLKQGCRRLWGSLSP